jgi:hypothetical protein
LDDPPTLEEVRKALNSAKKDKAAWDSKIPVCNNTVILAGFIR